MKKRYMPSILIVLCLLIAACVGVAYAKYASMEKAENLFSLSSNVKFEAYAAYSADTQTLYFLNDILIDVGKTIPGTDDTATAVYTNILGDEFETKNHWIKSYAANIETVKFLGDIAPINMSNWFSNCVNLTDIDGMAAHLDTSGVLSMYATFLGCKKLTELDLSGFDTKMCQDMLDMFSGCENLVTIYASQKFVAPTILFDIPLLFGGCESLVGGKGTTLATVQNTDPDKHLTVTYARIDGGTEAPGYFTDIAAKPTA